MKNTKPIKLNFGHLSRAPERFQYSEAATPYGILDELPPGVTQSRWRGVGRGALAFPHHLKSFSLGQTMVKFNGPKNREILSQSLKQKTESLKIKIYLNKIKGKTTGTRFVENEIRGMLPSQKVKPRKRSSRGCLSMPKSLNTYVCHIILNVQLKSLEDWSGGNFQQNYFILVCFYHIVLNITPQWICMFKLNYVKKNKSQVLISKRRTAYLNKLNNVVISGFPFV